MTTQTERKPQQLFPEHSARLRFTRGLWRFLGEILFFKTTWKMVVNGMENVPRSGPTILVQNHVSEVDTIAAGGPIKFRDPVPIGKQELVEDWRTAWILWGWAAITLRRGETEMAPFKRALEILNSKDILMIAPEGTRNKQGMRDPKEGVVMLASRANAVIVPVGVNGTEYFMRNLKRLRRTTVTVNYGKPIRLKAGINRKQYPQAAREIMYQLAPLLDPHLRGIYGDLSAATMETIEYV